MNKQEFLNKLENALAGLPKADVEERVSFYGEMIDDRIEEGASESEAIEEIGTVQEIVSQTLADTSITKLVKEKMKPKRSLRAWEIALIILGSPVWLPLLIAAAAVGLSLYIVIWAIIFSLWAAEISFWGCAVGGIAVGTFHLIQGYRLAGISEWGIACISVGVSIFFFFVCVMGSKGILRLTKKAAIAIKTLLVRKENAK